MGQNAVSQSSLFDEVYFWYADKNWSLLQVNAINLRLCNHACPKYPKEEIWIFLQYIQKSMEDEVDLLPGDKHESFLQIDSVT